MDVSTIPPTVYVAAGTLVAAFVTGAVSLVNIVMSKEHKISELRQEWINELRGDVSEFIASVNAAYKNWTAVRALKEKGNGDALSAYTNAMLPLYKDIDTFSHRIQLRLNPVEHKDIIELIKDIERQCSDLDGLNEQKMVLDKFNSLNDLTQSLLKVEWERVKAGEGGFKFLKRMFIGLFIIPLVVGSFEYGPYIVKQIVKVFS